MGKELKVIKLFFKEEDDDEYPIGPVYKQLSNGEIFPSFER